MPRKNTKAPEATKTSTGRYLMLKRAHEFNDGTVAFDMEVWDEAKNVITLYGLTLRKNKKGDDFVAFPQHKGKDGAYYKYFYTAFTDDELEEICKQIDTLL